MLISVSRAVSSHGRRKYVFDILQACELPVQFTTNKSLAK
jgi:hypothetical protein